MDKYIKADDLLEAIYPVDPENDGSDGSRVLYDKQNPRVEITITRMEGYQQWKTRKED